ASYRAALSGCDGGCDVVDLDVASAVDPTVAMKTSVEVVVASLGGISVTDRTRWRTSAEPAVLGPALTTGPGGLGIAFPEDAVTEGVRFDPRVFPLDAPLPLPPGVAGALPGRPEAGGPYLAALPRPPLPLRSPPTRRA